MGLLLLQALLACVGELNARPDVHGILVQLPLPAHVSVRGAARPLFSWRARMADDRCADRTVPIPVSTSGNRSYVPIAETGHILSPDLLFWTDHIPIAQIGQKTIPIVTFHGSTADIPRFGECVVCITDLDGMICASL